MAILKSLKGWKEIQVYIHMMKILVGREFPLPIISRFRMLIAKVNNTASERTPHGQAGTI